MKPRALGALLALSLALLLSGCANGTAAQPQSSIEPAQVLELAAAGRAFDRAELRIAADELFAIRFTNNDSVPHNVAIRGTSGGDEAGQVISGGSAASYVFRPLPSGSYRFMCDVHPEMTGTLIVEESVK